MAIAAKSPTLTETQASNEKFEAMNQGLDDDIASIRAEIRELKRQRGLLSASLLGSTRIQQRLVEVSTLDALPSETQSLLSASQIHAQENAYRLALGVTAFPFEDPSQRPLIKRLLGVRFDVADSEGQYDKPYYLLAKRVTDSSEELRIHRHTIPAFIPVRKYEQMYLPLQDEGYGSGETTSNDNQRQDFHGLVRHVRHDLVAWVLRREAIEHLQSQLNLSAQNSDEGEEVGMYKIKSLTATSVEAVQIRIEWTTNALARVRVSEKGMIEKAVVYHLRGRMREAENILTRDNCSIPELVPRLKAVSAYLEQQGGEDVDEDMDGE